MSVTRYDVAELGSIETTPQGFIRAPAYLTRAGVLDYRRPDGSVVRELRPPSEVFAPASIATLSAAPLTDLHPHEMVSPANVRKLAIGHVSDDVRQDGQHVAANMTVQDAAAIAAVEAGQRRELSCGYTCDLDETPGTYNGQPYDAVQRKIRYNHVGIGPRNWGRAGSSVALRIDAADINDAPEVMRLDAADAVAASRLNAPPAGDAPEPDPTDDELDAVLAERDALRAQVAALEQQLSDIGEQDALLAERDALRIQVAALRAQLEQSRTDHADRVDDQVQARAVLLAQVSRVLDADDWQQFDRTWTARRIHERVLQRFDRKLDVSRESDDYVRSRFDAAIARHEADAERARQRTSVVVDQHHNNADDVHAILSGHAHVVAPNPRRYEPAPWRQPLASNLERLR
jgi:hypothetical protein